jgi:hypothetical protein
MRALSTPGIELRCTATFPLVLIHSVDWLSHLIDPFVKRNASVIAEFKKKNWVMGKITGKIYHKNKFVKYFFQA